jgi:hypothetical protein
MSAGPLSQCLRSRYLVRRPLNVHGFSTRSNLRGGGGDHFDPPTGYLFNVKPGEKYQKEGWEGAFYYGFIGSLVLAGVAYVFKPDTSYVECTHLGGSGQIALRKWLQLPLFVIYGEFQG